MGLPKESSCFPEPVPVVPHDVSISMVLMVCYLCFPASSATDDVKGNNHSMWQYGSITIPRNMYIVFHLFFNLCLNLRYGIKQRAANSMEALCFLKLLCKKMLKMQKDVKFAEPLSSHSSNFGLHDTPEQKYCWESL